MHSSLQHPLRPLAAAAVAASLTLAVAGCGSSATSGTTAGGASSSSTTAASNTSSPTTSPSSSAVAGAHNDADVAFATGMIPHHRQAIAMAQMAATRAASAQVEALAARIKAAQAPEIALMSGWLAAWGEPIPTGMAMAMASDHSPHGSSATSGGAMAGMGMSGMMSGQEMQRMGRMSGPTFHRAFLKGMVVHHRGAVAMAQTELRQGTNAEAKRLAQSIIDSQTAEINEMTQVLQVIK
jgi:uncharacterized protein (DUF305 family)